MSGGGKHASVELANAKAKGKSNVRGCPRRAKAICMVAQDGRKQAAWLPRTGESNLHGCQGRAKAICMVAKDVQKQSARLPKTGKAICMVVRAGQTQSARMFGLSGCLTSALSFRCWMEPMPGAAIPMQNGRGRLGCVEHV
eukprot:353986-Chlamydomonas_euryale.AAC.1